MLQTLSTELYVPFSMVGLSGLLTACFPQNNQTGEIHSFLTPNPPHPEVVYLALLYSLSKALIRQVEEEVTAKASTAFPLARIAMNLVGMGHTQFAEVFVATLNAATAGWAVGIPVPQDGVRLLLSLFNVCNHI